MTQYNSHLYPVPEDSPSSESAIPPHDTHAEELVLGSMLLAPSCIHEVLNEISGNDFYNPAYNELFDTIFHNYSHNLPVEIIAVHRSLPGPTKNILSPSSLFGLVEKVASPHSATYYAKNIKKMSLLRKIAQTATLTNSQVHRQLDPYDITSGAIAQLTKTLNDQESEGVTAYDAATEAAHYSAARADGSITEDGLRTGYAELDDMLGGIRSGQLILCAGRPGTGKSVMALDIARNIALRQQQAVLFFSLEMSQLEIGQRILSAETSIPLRRVINGELADSEWEAIRGKQEELKNAPLFLDTRSRVTTMDIRARSHQMKITHDVRMIIVDYLGLVSHPREHKMESRQAIVSDISRDLKLIAKDLSPVLALAQLNRAVESRNDKKPLLSDLRDSGALEQDSDVVILLHREDLYNPDSPRAGEIDVTVAKHRNGPTGSTHLANQYHLARMQNLF